MRRRNWGIFCIAAFSAMAAYLGLSLSQTDGQGAKNNSFVDRQVKVADNNTVVVNDEKKDEVHFVDDDSQLGRQTQVESFCERDIQLKQYSGKTTIHRVDYKHILVDNQHKVLFCYVPKAGSTAWKNKLIGFNTEEGRSPIHGQKVHDKRVLQSFGLDSLKNFNETARNYFIKNYYKIIIVRHPLTRLVSGFRNRFELAKRQVNGQFTADIVKFNKDFKESLIITDKIRYNITFKQFLEYMFTPGNEAFANNEHWDTIERLCSPCHIHYDYIGKQETYMADAKELIPRVFKSNNIGFEKSSLHSTATDPLMAVRYFHELPKELKKKVLYRYRRDASLFRYNFDGYL